MSSSLLKSNSHRYAQQLFPCVATSQASASMRCQILAGRHGLLTFAAADSGVEPDPAVRASLGALEARYRLKTPSTKRLYDRPATVGEATVRQNVSTAFHAPTLSMGVPLDQPLFVIVDDFDAPLTTDENTTPVADEEITPRPLDVENLALENDVLQKEVEHMRARDAGFFRRITSQPALCSSAARANQRGAPVLCAGRVNNGFSAVAFTQAGAVH